MHMHCILTHPESVVAPSLRYNRTMHDVYWLVPCHAHPSRMLSLSYPTDRRPQKGGFLGTGMSPFPAVDVVPMSSPSRSTDPWPWTAEFHRTASSPGTGISPSPAIDAVPSVELAVFHRPLTMYGLLPEHRYVPLANHLRYSQC